MVPTERVEGEPKVTEGAFKDARFGPDSWPSSAVATQVVAKCGADVLPQSMQKGPSAPLTARRT